MIDRRPAGSLAGMRSDPAIELAELRDTIGRLVAQ
jgi:hypothetical protein